MLNLLSALFLTIKSNNLSCFLILKAWGIPAVVSSIILVLISSCYLLCEIVKDDDNMVLGSY